MKKIITVMIIALTMSSLSFGQAVSEPPAPRATRTTRLTPATPEITTVSGKLVWANGGIAMQNADAVFYFGACPLIGFVDGLEEGASVTLEGYVFDIPFRQLSADANTPAAKMIRVTKFTFNGKDYELTPGFGRMHSGFGRMYPGFGGMYPRFGREASPRFHRGLWNGGKKTRAR